MNYKHYYQPTYAHILASHKRINPRLETAWTLEAAKCGCGLGLGNNTRCACLSLFSCEATHMLTQQVFSIDAKVDGHMDIGPNEFSVGIQCQ